MLWDSSITVLIISYLCVHQSSFYYAYLDNARIGVAKVFDAMHEDDFTREVDMRSKLGDHPHLITFEKHLSFLSRDKTIHAIVMPFCPRSLQDLLVQFRHMNASIPHSTLNVIIKGCVAALEEMHRQRVAHCDIKPGNIMLGLSSADSNPVLVDFGGASEFGDVMPEGGTRRYWLDAEFDRADPALDWICLGATICESLCLELGNPRVVLASHLERDSSLAGLVAKTCLKGRAPTPAHLR